MFRVVLSAIMLFVVTVLFSACEDKTKVTTIAKDVKPTIIKDSSVDTSENGSKENKKVSTNSAKDQILSDVSLDTAKITSLPNRPAIIIFESPTCKYCNKLKKDISSNEKLKEKLKKEFAVYLVDATVNRMHQIAHEGEFMQVDTNTLVSIYGVTATPTIIMTDENTKSVIVVPGYMNPKQFLVTLDFIKDSKLWMGKDRKNGEVYKALKEFYIQKGILDKDGKPIKDDK